MTEGLAARIPKRVGTLPVRLAVEGGIFAVASAGASLLAAVSVALLARSLTPSEFGTYAFGVAFLQFGALFFEFGLFLPAARALARSSAEESRRVVGASLVAYLPIGLGFAASVVVASYVSDALFHVDAGHALRVAAPVAFAYPFVLVGMLLAQGAGRLHVYSSGVLIMQGLFLAAVVGSLSVGWVGVSQGLALRGLAVVASSVLVVWWLRPRFEAVGAGVRMLLRDARAFGFQVYVGRVLGTGTYNMDTLMLAAWSDARQVGIYALAAAFAAAAGLPAHGLASALFRRMANHDRIERRWLLAAIGLSVVCTATAVALARPVVLVALSDRYLGVVGLVLPLSLAQAVRGVTALFNSFLAAHGEGKRLRNAAIVFAVSNLALNFALIPPYGAAGAAWASFGAIVANSAAHVHAYRAARRIGARQKIDEAGS